MTEQHDNVIELWAKISVFGMSILLGLVVGVVLHELLDVPILFSVLSGLVAALLNPLVAAAFASVCEFLHKLAFPDSYSSWSTENRAFQGAFWPLTTTYWMVIAIFFTTINRVFRSRGTPLEAEGPPFLIEVARCQTAEDIRLKDLLITHPGCGGGKFRPSDNDTYLNCPRCHVHFEIEPGEHSIGAICQTAFDGKARNVVAKGFPTKYARVLVQAQKGSEEPAIKPRHAVRNE